MEPSPTSEDFEAIEFAAFAPLDRYKFMTATVVPRPIALVTSLGSGQQVNAAPFSQFIILSSTPPILGIVVGQYPEGPKDTYQNILRNREYVINAVGESMAEITQLCAVPLAEHESEVESLGLEVLPSSAVDAPRLACAPLAFECVLHGVQRFGNTASLLSGEVIAIQARKGLVNGHHVDHQGLQPLGRISGRRYCRTQDVMEMSEALDDPFRQRFRPDTAKMPGKFA